MMASHNGLSSLTRILAALVGVLAACATSAFAQTLTLGTKLELNTLDPHFFNAFPTGSSHAMFYEKLVQIDAQGKVQPQLATTWRIVDAANPLIWEFKLRRGVKFHDGASFGADDVIATIERVPTVPNSPNLFTQFTRNIVKMEKVDDLTVRLTTREPHPSLHHDLGNVFIVSSRIAKSASTADFNSGKAVIGTGPYKYVEWVNGDRLIAERFDAYWGDKPTWQRVTEKVIATDATRMAALLSGQVDAIDVVPSADLPRLKRETRFALFKGPAALIHYIALDTDRDVSPFVAAKGGGALASNPLKDVRVRRALSLALNRAVIVDKLLEGSGVPAAQVTLPALPGSSKTLKADAPDMARAQALLKEAGWAQGFKLTLHVTSGRYPNDTGIGQTIAQAWSRLGLDVAVEAVPGQIFFTRATKQEFSAFSAQYGADEVGAGLRALVAAPNRDRGYGTGNRVKYSNPAADGLLFDALTTMDSAQRDAKLARAAEAYMADQAIIPVFHPIIDFAAKKGLVISPTVQRRFNALMIRPTP